MSADTMKVLILNSYAVKAFTPSRIPVLVPAKGENSCPQW